MNRGRLHKVSEAAAEALPPSVVVLGVLLALGLFLGLVALLPAGVVHSAAEAEEALCWGRPELVQQTPPFCLFLLGLPRFNGKVTVVTKIELRLLLIARDAHTEALTFCSLARR
jgi:hypothetical protein